jgi:hypothetical protein
MTSSQKDYEHFNHVPAEIFSHQDTKNKKLDTDSIRILGCGLPKRALRSAMCLHAVRYPLNAVPYVFSHHKMSNLPIVSVARQK